MSYLAALQGAPAGPAAPPQPASLGMGPPPTSGMGAPPPPTMKGPIPTGGAGGTRLTAAGDFIASAKNLQGFIPELSPAITAIIAQVKEATKKDVQANGPAIGTPGVPGSAQLDGSQLQDSGSPGPM